MGGPSGSPVDVGIDDDFTRRVRDQVTPSTSALFVLSSDAVTDRVEEALAASRWELIATIVSKEQGDKLRTSIEHE